jgi:VCBS repeat-containing protein
VAVADSYGVSQNDAITVLPPGVLENDTDPEGNPLSAALVAGPANGVLTFSTNGGFVYTPNTGYSGPDSFTYVAQDAYATSAVTTVTLTVTTNHIPPIAVADSYTTDPNESLSPDFSTGVLVNDEDVDNLPLTAQLQTGTSNGTLTFNSDGSFTYTPNANFTGTDSFTYKAFNGSLYSEAATVSISVTDAPPVAASITFTAHGTNTLTVEAPGILENDSEPVDGAVITAVLVAGPHHGTLALDPSGEFTYTANAGFLGTDYFSYRPTDGIVTGGVAQVTISVANQQPVAGDDEYEATENTELIVTSDSGVLDNDFDGDDDALTAILQTGTSNGILALNADGSFTYTPNGGFTGTDTFTYVANDGYTNSLPATVTITVDSGGPVAHVPPPAGAPPKELDLTAVAFGGGSIIASDTVRPLIGGPPQWLDNGNGIINPFIGERSYPYSYVRGSTLFARAVFSTPNRNAFRGGNGRYVSIKLRGRLYNNGVAIPGAQVTPVRSYGLTPNRFGTGATYYADVRANMPFANTVGFLNLKIVWEYSVDNGATWTRCAPPNTPAIAAAGTSWHRIYLTWGIPQAWPLFETEVVYGSVTGAGQVNPGPLLNKIWSNFSGQNAKRADGTPMTYYHDWNVPTIGLVPDLLRLHDGRCGQWALFFIGTLQAQGLAPFTMRPTAVYTVPRFGFAQCRMVNMPFMVAKWNFGFPGVAGPTYPGLVQGTDYSRRLFVDFAFPYENVFFINPFDTFTPYAAAVLPPAPGHWGFNWQIPPQVDYVGGAGLNKGQNNPTPRPLFTDHAIVFYAGKFFDPSYGTVYANAQDMQNQGISGISYATIERDWLLNPFTGAVQLDINGFPVLLNAYPVLHMRATPLWSPPLIYFCIP